MWGQCGLVKFNSGDVVVVVAFIKMSEGMHVRHYLVHCPATPHCTLALMPCTYMCQLDTHVNDVIANILLCRQEQFPCFFWCFSLARPC